MKKIKFRPQLFFIIVFLATFFTACNDNDDSNQTARMMVRMTDAPGDYDAVYINVQDIKIKASTDTGEEGWVSIASDEFVPGEQNLLDLTGGVSLLLADNVVPAGELGQIRLVLGDGNYFVKDGVDYPLATPSAMQSGLKLQVNQTLQAGATYEFVLDFDVSKSIVTAGTSGSFNLKPVIRVSATATSGVIKGKIDPILEGYQVLASVQVGEADPITAYADETGMFQLNGVPAGTYTLTLTPDAASGKTPIVVENVMVENGEVTDVGSVAFE
ncbi:Starch-binding domain-like protein [Flavobacterium daejeonense]|nr:Starch-binding domain-like protein [Flavobacterium daejeonense]